MALLLTCLTMARKKHAPVRGLGRCNLEPIQLELKGVVLASVSDSHDIFVCRGGLIRSECFIDARLEPESGLSGLTLQPNPQEKSRFFLGQNPSPRPFCKGPNWHGSGWHMLAWQAASMSALRILLCQMVAEWRWRTLGFPPFHPAAEALQCFLPVQSTQASDGSTTHSRILEFLPGM